jgi:hypothetical protein
MCHDGTSSTDILSRDTVSGDTEVDSSRLAEQERRRYFQGFIAWIIPRGFNAALVNEVEWRDSKVLFYFNIELFERLTLAPRSLLVLWRAVIVSPICKIRIAYPRGTT